MGIFHCYVCLPEGKFFFSRKTARYFGEILWFLYFLFLGGSFLLFLSFQMVFFFQVLDSDLEIFLP